MTANLPPAIERAGPFSQRLLDHDGLMTPVLQAAFGPLAVRQSQVIDSVDRLRRRSSIHQAVSGAKILDAVLNVSLPALPDGFLEQLQHSDVLFGQLLSDFGLTVRTTNRILYQSLTDNPCRLGRRVAILRRDTDALVCQVDELLVSEAQLLALRVAS